jgi:L-asparaginase
MVEHCWQPAKIAAAPKAAAISESRRRGGVRGSDKGDLRRRRKRLFVRENGIMQQKYGQCRGPLVLLHGGAGGMDPKSPAAMLDATTSLRSIATAAMRSLEAGKPAIDVVTEALQAMELDPQFNAGRGSALQADGQARLTAALMDGAKQSFSGVISSTYLVHPSLLARHLQGESARVLTSPGTELLARTLHLPIESAVTPARLAQWQRRASENGLFCDTVGCVVRTPDGRLFVGASTGGRGYEYPGRVSDSGTVAGTYGSAFAAIAATGTGEEIVDDALAARLETRRRDGATLEQASQRCFTEGQERKRAYGWICADRDGAWGVAHLTPSMAHVVMTSGGQEISASI